MFRRSLLLGGTLLLAGAMFFVNPSVVEARGGGHGGGGHGGGFHGGGFHGGGFHGGGFHGGFHGGFNRGFGGFNHGIGFNRGFGGFNHFNHGFGFNRGFNRGFGGLGLYGLGYGYWPWWYGGGLLGGYGGYGYGGDGNYYGNGGYSGYSPYYYDSTPYYYNYTPGTTPGYDDSLPAPTSAPAHLIVNVPANAQIWVNGQKVDSTGTKRNLTTPALSSASRYTYDIKATWDDNGKSMSETHQVIVTAGSNANVSFPGNSVSSR